MKLVFFTFILWLMATGKFGQYLAYAKTKASTGETTGDKIGMQNGMFNPGFTDSTIASKVLSGSLMPSVQGAGALS